MPGLASWGKVEPSPSQLRTMTDLSQTPFVPIRVATGLGTLALRPRRFGDLGAVADIAPDDTSAARLRRLFARVATVEGEGAPLSSGLAGALEDEDLEAVADAYLAMPDVRLLSEGGAGREPLAREVGETAIAYLDRLLRADQDRQLADLGGTFAALQSPNGGDLESALAALEAEAAALRDAVAALAEAGGGAPVAPGVAADGDGAAPPSRADAALLNRYLTRVTARSALLQASVSDASAAALRRADAAAQATRASSRRTLAVAALAALLAAAAAALAALGVAEERDDARAFQRWQAAAMAALQEERLARAAAQQAQDARLQQIADRQAATTAALRAAPIPAAMSTDAAATNVVRHDSAKASSKARAPPQRKANR